MKKLVAVLLAVAFAGGNAIVASAAPATVDKPAASGTERVSPQPDTRKHVAKARTKHHNKTAARAKKPVKTPTAS